MIKNTRSVWKSTLLTWPSELLECYRFEYNTEGTKAIKATCIACSNHWGKISSEYRGKLTNDVMTYAISGTGCLLKPNLKRHTESKGHIKCKEIETGAPACKKQKTIDTAFGGARNRALASIKPLLFGALHLGRTEKPYVQFPGFLDTVNDMGLKLTSAYNNSDAAKAFNHIISDQMVDDVKTQVKEANFFSWLMDGSTAAKRKLTYETELIYIRTANNLIPKTELFAYVPMQAYGSVSADNLGHALRKQLLLLGGLESDHELICKHVDDVPLASLTEALAENYVHFKNVGAGADGASINFGCKKGLIVQYQEMSPWVVGIHCFSHRLELAAKDSVKAIFSEVDQLLLDLYSYFKESQKQWSLCLKLAEKLEVVLMKQPKASGTRFLPHTQGALKALNWNWVVYIMHFSNVKAEGSDGRASAWLSKLLDFKFMCLCRVYEDILHHLSRTARVFQADKPRSIADAERMFQLMKAEQVMNT